MSEPKSEPMTWGEWLKSTLALVAPFAGLALAGWLCGGCINENTGTSTVIGEQMALPEITDSSDNVSVRVYESIKGARVWTAKDSNVTIEYGNAYTNSYFGIVETRDSMMLKVRVENVAKPEEAATNEVVNAIQPVSTNSVESAD